MGGEALDDTVDLEEQIRRLEIKADKIALVSSKGGYFDVMDAWWMLVYKGMKNIICMIAEVTEYLKVRTTWKKLTLYS